MAYLGTKPQSGFISQEANQYFTGLTQNYIDLNQSISSLSSVIVLVNGVVQENSDLTLTSSTRITLGATLVSADKVTCIYVAKISSTQAPATGTVTNDMLAGSIANDKLAGSIANSKLANSSITLNGSAVSLGGSASVGVTNTPLWKIWRSGAWSLSTGTDTKVPFNTWSLDPDSILDATNNRVVPGVAGKYFIVVQARMDSSTNFNMWYVDIRIDGANKSNAQVYHDHAGTVTTSLVADLTSSNYIESYAMQNSGGTINGMGGVQNTWIQGFRIS